MSTSKQTFAQIEARFNSSQYNGRSKYSAQQKAAMLNTGQAIVSPATGKASFPIKDKDDVKAAVKAVGLGAADDSDIRRHIVKNAAKIKALHLIPGSWNADGSKNTGALDASGNEQNGDLSQKRSSKPKKQRHRTAQRTAAGLDVVSYGIEQRGNSTGFKVIEGKGDEAFIDGCAIRYSPTVSKIRDSAGTFGEEVMPGALKGADTSDIRFLVNHAGVPLARWCPSKDIRTLQLDDRKDGLYFRAAVDLRSQEVNDICVALDNKSIDQCSYGFTMQGGKETWSRDYGHRTIKQYGSIVDCSVVTYPAEPSTSAGVDMAARALAEATNEIRSGRVISKKTAKRLVAAHGALTAAGQSTSEAATHIEGLLQDAAVGGLGQQTPGGAGPGLGSLDGTGSRSRHSWRSLDEIVDAYFDGTLTTDEYTQARSDFRAATDLFARLERSDDEDRAYREYVRNGGR